MTGKAGLAALGGLVVATVVFVVVAPNADTGLIAGISGAILGGAFAFSARVERLDG